MALDFSKEVDHVARLARLHLSEAEKKVMAGQLGAILEAARRVQEVDTSGVEPTAHVAELPVAFREDMVQQSLPLVRVLQNAPHREAGFFRVPRITGEENDGN
ncbi:MAG TPA: Asp-tRNA(Asn)/Glu-tRNA(Gln) amidotransferase subunit GatC [Bacillota bacterium]|nr:Asp-tRNA(Asn)/Glu-tRNA(Gln) amidotransferase subunit GatC [Bacillota bacterium]